MAETRRRKGQTLVEYVLSVCAVLAVAGALAYVASAAKRAAERNGRLMASDYP